MCDQQSLRSVCAYAQSDQSLCSSLEYSMSVKLLTEHHLDFLSLKGGCKGLSESIHVKNATLLEITCRGSYQLKQEVILINCVGSGRVLDSRPKGRGFEPHRRHCVVVLEQDTFILA